MFPFVLHLCGGVGMGFEEPHLRSTLRNTLDGPKPVKGFPPVSVATARQGGLVLWD